MYSAFDAYADFICNSVKDLDLDMQSVALSDSGGASKTYNYVEDLDDLDPEMQLAIHLSMAESAAPSDSGGASKSSGASFDVNIIYYKDKDKRVDKVTVNPRMKKIRELIEPFIRKHKKYHFRAFIISGRNLLTQMDRSVNELTLYNNANIHAVGLKILKNESEMVEYIKSLTVNFTNKPLLITQYKLVVTIPSGQWGKEVIWHKDNIGKQWDWKNIAERVFEDAKVNIIFTNLGPEKGGNSIIFYHEQYLELFAECLNFNGVEYNTSAQLLNLIKIGLEESDSKYYTKMTIINVLFGDLLGGGQEAHALPEEDRDQRVINAFNQYLDMHDPNSNSI